MKHTKLFNATRRSLVAGAALVGCLSFPGLAQAGQITFSFNCIITGATTCIAGGPFGTLTLTDSLVDANRVDVDVVLNAANIQAQMDVVNGLNDFFLNYNGPTPANSSFKMVQQSDPFGTFSGTAGDGEINLNNKGPLGTTLDIALNPTGSIPVWTYSASIVLRLDGNHTETDLDVNMFILKDANDLLYAGFDTLPTNHRFFGGATEIGDAGITSVTPVPEPASLVLMSVAGLLTAARVARRRTSKQ